jgi:hypothetical protein
MSSLSRSETDDVEHTEEDEEQDTFGSPIRLDTGGRFGALTLDDDGESSSGDESS